MFWAQDNFYKRAYLISIKGFSVLQRRYVSFLPEQLTEGNGLAYTTTRSRDHNTFIFNGFHAISFCYSKIDPYSNEWM
ncbi:MAG: hypothetical protein CL868_15420 [Cytophagaceae bacterium]|nr:hypothetical protein [Cytophagaceae bacterium]